MTSCEEGVRREVVEAMVVRALFCTAGLFEAALSKSSVILDDEAAIFGRLTGYAVRMSRTAV
jgi:hypothetical protein